ncbi:hypothetical protein APS56_03120 [Pseudalgibacter alginicilyticus]|uniref:Uncharacterized protein n=1 Tax=Pseudalgibacter alginicilyticus TaxID=1736674 RepID=A0A0N7HY41_9FLAO|nr:hypothetical protein [Pseudalgibacter alginicilyticus]ALJ04198.1 hypothetical protein APS56_03120 [Pseudalgibacter alginicilyticus]
MKILILATLTLFISLSVSGQVKPKEIKEEIEVKTIKVNNGEKITENKVRVITREEADIELDENDAQKVNQNRIKANVKVNKTISVDNDSDNNYDTQSTALYYKIGNNQYQFVPNENGFDIGINNNPSDFKKLESAWHSSSKGHYIINGEFYNGLGYFDDENNLIVDYYNENTNKVETKTYSSKK